MRPSSPPLRPAFDQAVRMQHRDTARERARKTCRLAPISRPELARPGYMTPSIDQHRQPFSGYHRILDAQEDFELTHVGPRTPCGEYMRRFWQPVAMSAEIGD